MCNAGGGNNYLHIHKETQACCKEFSEIISSLLSNSQNTKRNGGQRERKRIEKNRKYTMTTEDTAKSESVQHLERW